MSSYADGDGAEDLVDKGKGKKLSSLEDKHVPVLPPSSDSSSFLGDNFIPGHFYDIDHSNPPLDCPLQINCASFPKVSEKGEGSLSLCFPLHKGFVENMPTLDAKYDMKALFPHNTLPERRNSRSFQTSRIEENPQTNTNEDSVKTLLEQMFVFAILKKFGIGCLVHYLSMKPILQKKTSFDFWIQYMLINELKDYKANFEKTSIELQDLQEKYKLLVSELEEKENHIQLQEEELQKRRHSAKSVSDGAVKFSKDIVMHSDRVMNILEETQTETYHKLTSLENKFMEAAARDEVEAKRKISTILANFESNRVAMVSEASKILQEANIQHSTILQQERVNVEELAKEAIKKINEHM
ncbi:kinesin protein KIN-5B [Trifolium repens]|nr:kinesin protein KIN-5B [Trifolium repens]